MIESPKKVKFIEINEIRKGCLPDKSIKMALEMILEYFAEKDGKRRGLTKRPLDYIVDDGEVEPDEEYYPIREFTANKTVLFPENKMTRVMSICVSINVRAKLEPLDEDIK